MDEEYKSPTRPAEKRETKEQLRARLLEHYAGVLGDTRHQAYNEGKLAAEARFKKELSDAQNSQRIKLLDAVGKCLSANAQAQESLSNLIDNIGGLRL